MSRQKIVQDKPEILCPFFRSRRPCAIGCEGIGGGSTLEIIFRNNRERDLQIRIFCTYRYTYCEAYRAVLRARGESDC